MANFNTHLNVATIVTGLSAGALLTAQHIDVNTAIGLWILGSIGGLLPDIDADNSKSLDTLFRIFSFGILLFLMYYLTSDRIGKMSFAELIIIPSLVYLFMKHLIRPFFETYTVHRGSCHSLLFLLLASLLTVQFIVIFKLEDVTIAWLAGGFVFLGGLVHLILDEMYSIDLKNGRIKKSFGTALKIADFKNKMLTFLMIIAILLTVYTLPSPSGVIEMLSHWDQFTFTPSHYHFLG